jgi:glucose/arabinose dehydrogenase
VQGVAVHPETDEVYAAEHGPTRDDEVNRLQAGANYGWDPSQGGTVGGYDESVPMTDLERFPDAIPAAWSSGNPVEAICGAAFLSGGQWGDLDGTLAVAALRGQKLLLMRLGPDGAVAQVSVPAPLDDTYGRLRGVRVSPDGALFVTTSNGDDDSVLRIDPV